MPAGAHGAYWGEPVRSPLGDACLHRSELSDADLRGADLSGADLGSANLRGADLRGASLAYANISGADFSGAKLQGADLRRTNAVESRFDGADLSGCLIYGLSAWSMKVEGATQQDLVITDDGEPCITVDDIELGQFIYLLLNNNKLRGAIDTITSKTVLILGRFTPERKRVLDALRDALRERGYLPEGTVPTTAVPVQPLLEGRHLPYSMLGATAAPLRLDRRIRQGPAGRRDPAGGSQGSTARAAPARSDGVRFGAKLRPACDT